MSMIKKLLALTLALAMVLSVSAFAGYAADTYADAAEIDGDCEEAVELLYALNIMTGDGKNFNPNSAVTRAEMAKMIYVILNKGDADASTYVGAKMFSDVQAGAWYEGYVNYAAATKLVQGRPDGTFGPNDAVTTAEAAKMLLTAIGYSAEGRGYVGANWDKNVLSDAAIIGLLNDYNTSVAAYAPRQWVAVMMANALTEALTYKTMQPAFSGLLTSGNSINGGETLTMGEKYFNMAAFEDIAVATENATMTGKFAKAGVLFDNGKDVKNTGLGALDLGQTYVVIYNTKTMKAYSVRSTSDVAEAYVRDMEVEVKYGTSSNKANNKYEFTIDEMVAKFGKTEIPVLYTGTEYTEDEFEATEISVTEMRKLIEDKVLTNDVYKAIDTDADGAIDYMIVVEYDYAQVTKDGSHNKYGDYIKLENAAGDTVKFNGEANLYLDDAIISEDELAKTYFVKYTWDIDAGKYVIETLSPVEGATYDARDNKKEIYTIDGEDYMIAEKAYDWGTAFKTWLKESKLGKTVNYVADGELLIARWDDDASYIDEIDEFNANLALIIDMDSSFSTGTLHEKNYVEYMTIDGETAIAEYKGDEAEFKALEKKFSLENYDDEADLEGRLFVYELDSKGRISLTEIDKDTLEDLSVASSLLNVYAEKEDKLLDATGSSVKFDGDKMAAENSFFYAYDDDGEPVFGVITPAEMGDGYDEETYGQVFSYEKSTNKRTTVLAGYVVFDLTSDQNNNFLYIKEIGKETKDGLKLTVEFIGGEEEVIYVKNDQTFYTDLLYTYIYKTMDDEYTLSLVEDVAGSVEWYDEEDFELSLKGDEDLTLDVSDDDDVDNIVIVTIEYVRDETQTDKDDEDYLNEENYKEYERTLEIVAYEDLKAEAIEADETDSYVQTSYWFYSGSADLVYIVVLHDMTQAQ